VRLHVHCSPCRVQTGFRSRGLDDLDTIAIGRLSEVEQELRCTRQPTNQLQMRYGL
jgi:hypothetical protein